MFMDFSPLTLFTITFATLTGPQLYVYCKCTLLEKLCKIVKLRKKYNYVN